MIYAKPGEGDEYELRGDASRTYDVKRDVKIVEWRAKCFREYGFTQLEADALAVRRDVDRELVEDLLSAGATHAQVRAIVA